MFQADPPRVSLKYTANPRDICTNKNRHHRFGSSNPIQSCSPRFFGSIWDSNLLQEIQAFPQIPYKSKWQYMVQIWTGRVFTSPMFVNFSLQLDLELNIFRQQKRHLLTKIYTLSLYIYIRISIGNIKYIMNHYDIPLVGVNNP